MTRRQSKNSLFFYLLIFFICAALFFRYGLDIFVDWAFTINQKNKSTMPKKSSQGAKITLISDPILEEMPDATNEAILVIKGRADPDTLVELYHNQQKASSLNADFNGQFEFEQLLEERNNQFYVVSTDSYSQKQTQSKLYNVTFIKEPPNLEISSPQDNKKYYDSKLIVEGITDSEVYVKVNNASVVVKADGSFSHSLQLQKGENQIEIIASDQAGNTTEKKLSVTYVQ